MSIQTSVTLLWETWGPADEETWSDWENVKGVGNQCGHWCHCWEGTSVPAQAVLVGLPDWRQGITRSNKEFYFTSHWQAGDPHCPWTGTLSTLEDTHPCGQVAPCCSHGSSPLVGKGCLHVMCCVHYWSLSAVPEAFTCQVCSPL